MSEPNEPASIEALQQQLTEVREKGDRIAECEILGKLGIAYYQAQQWQEAIPILTEYLNLARELGNQWQEGVAQYYLGFAQQIIGENWPAVEALSQAYRLLRQFGKEEFSSQAWQQLVQQGQRYFEQKQFVEALQLYQLQIKLLLEFDDLKAANWVAIELGKIHYYQGDFQKALSCYAGILEASQTLKEPVMESLALAWLGCSHRELGEIEPAFTYFEQRLAVAQQLEDKAAQQETLGWLIDISKQLGRHEKAVHYYQLQTSFWQESQNHVNEYASIYDLAMLQFNSRQYKEALTNFEKALQIAEALEDAQEKIAHARYMLGRCFHTLEQKETAISWYQQAVKLYFDLEVNNWADKGLDHLVNLYRELQQYDKEIECQKQKLKLVKKTEDRVAEQSLLYKIGNLYNNLKQDSQAIEYFQQALILAQTLEQREYQANAYYMLGQSYQNLEQKETAISWYQQAVDLYLELGIKNWALSGLEYLVNLSQELQNYEQAIAYQQCRLEIIKELGDPVTEQSCTYDLARWQFNRSQYQEALTGFETALQLAETLETDEQKVEKIANTHYMLGQTYRNLEQTDKAIQHYSQAIKLYIEQSTGREWAVKALNYVSDIYRNSQEYTEAIEQQKKRLELVRELDDCYLEHETFYSLGCLYDDIQEHSAALEYFLSALKLANELDHKVNAANTHYMLALTYEKLNQIDEAISHIQEAEKLYRETGTQKWVENSHIKLQKLEEKKIEADPKTWKNRADQLFVIENYQEAIACYEKLPQPELEPNYLLAWESLGVQQLNAKNYEAAFISFRQVIKLNSGYSSAWVNQGRTLIMLKRYEEAIISLDFAIELESNNHDAWCNRASVLLSLKRYQEALDSSQKALELDCNCYTAWNNRGAILANGFQLYVEALEAFNRVLYLKHNDEIAIKNRHTVLSKLGFSQEEIDQNDSSLKVLELNNSQDWKQLGILRCKQGRHQEALIAYDQALALNPNDYEIWREKGSVQWNLAYLQGNSARLKEAIDFYNKAVALNPFDSATYISIANSFLAIGLSKEALTYFKRNLLLSHNQNWKAWVGRGKALVNLENYEEALQNYTNAWEWLVSNSEDYQESCGAIIYHKGLVYLAQAQKQKDCQDYWQQAKDYFETAIEYFTDNNLLEWYLRVLQDMIPVYRELGETKKAQNLLYEGIDLLNQLIQEATFQHQKDDLYKEFISLKQWHTDELAEYRTLFMELLNGVDEGWEQSEILEYLGEQLHNPYLIRWLHNFGRDELGKTWGVPDFDLGYLMIQLGKIGCGQLGEVAQKLGQKIIERTIEKAEEEIDQAYQEPDQGGYRRSKLDHYIYELDKWAWDYRIFQACRPEKQQKLERFEEEIVSRYIDKLPLFDDYLAWFNCGIELKQLNYHSAAIIAFARTLRLTQGQFWEAWANRGWIFLRKYNQSYDKALENSDAGLNNLHRSERYSQDSSGILYEIKGDYYQEGYGILYEIKGDWFYRYEHVKGPSRTGITPINADNGGLPNYIVWRDWWESAYNYYRKALDCFITPRLRERRLGILQKLVKICRCLGNKDEVQYFEQEGCDLLGCLLQEMPSNEAKILLARKFAAFDQYRVDSLAESGKIVQALKFAEWRKNLCLRWLSSNQWVNKRPNLDNEALIFLKEIQPLLDGEIAGVYWHISPAAISAFIIKEQKMLLFKVLKNEYIYKQFAHPQPNKWGEIIIPMPKVTEEDFIKGTSGVYDNQLVKFEYWMEEWKRDYRDYRSGKKKEPDRISQQLEDENNHPATHPWREKMLEDLKKLGEILQIEEIVSEYLSDVKKLILIPHRDLHLVPLEYLFRDKGFAISRLPSFQIGLDLAGAKVAPELPPLSIEHPYTASSLRFAKIESTVIAHLYQIPKENRLADRDVTKKRILEVIQVAADILHFTGHGEHDLDSPSDSALILADGAKLTLRELLSLPLREYYLVCLSACETGLTSTTNLIDEFVGLVSGFLARKTAYVLSTLWTVDEISTALLIIDFYRRIRQSVQDGVPIHPAQALEEAKCWLRTLSYSKLADEYEQLAGQLETSSPSTAEYLETEAFAIRKDLDKMKASQPPFEHPYYWAGFTLTGRMN